MNFGKRDLGLVLSETVGDADTLRFTKDARYAAVTNSKGSQTDVDIMDSQRNRICSMACHFMPLRASVGTQCTVRLKSVKSLFRRWVLLFSWFSVCLACATCGAEDVCVDHAVLPIYQYCMFSSSTAIPARYEYEYEYSYCCTAVRTRNSYFEPGSTIFCANTATRSVSHTAGVSQFLFESSGECRVFSIFVSSAQGYSGILKAVLLPSIMK